MIDSVSKKSSLSFTYNFSHRETSHLAYFLRKHQNEVPDALADFLKAVESAIYNSMTIDEAEKFYS
ncbi:MAG: hypothetical protein IKI31_07315 [Treponema sp.]|nr:hypothetical protein [Treponema sp.]